jgi:hypothetical protein
MIAKTDYQRNGAGDLVRYIERDTESDNDVALKGPHGQKLSKVERDRFIERSEDHGMERHFIIAPDPDATYDATEMDRRTRELMNDWTEDSTADYVYAVHDKGEKPHAHVAVTGQERHLRMDREDLAEFREQARSTFQERDRLSVERHRERQSTQSSERGIASTTSDSEKLPWLDSEASESQEASDNRGRTWRPGSHPFLKCLDNARERASDDEPERDYGGGY